MTTSRTVTILTANFGRGAPADRFEANLDRVLDETPGQHRFFQFQEIDEANPGVHELRMIKQKLKGTHKLVGSKTRVPIAVPNTFTVLGRSVVVAAEGVDNLSPRRHVVQANVCPDGLKNCRVVATNTHFPRDDEKLLAARRSSDETLKLRVAKPGRRTKPLSVWLTGDLNSQHYEKLAPNEQRLVTARLDYIRAYPAGGVKMKTLKTGSIDLTIDGHNAHWAKVLITWP